MALLEGTRFFEILVIIAFFTLLLASLFMLINFYVCDGHNCKAFKTANEEAPEGSKENILVLLAQLFNDGIWPIPYIGAAILTPLSLWFLSIPITMKTFGIMFFTSFVVVYFMFSFFGHHYLNPITTYVSEYIQDQCPGIPSVSPGELPYNEDEIYDDTQDIINDNVGNKFESFSDVVGITFATPVNIF